MDIILAIVIAITLTIIIPLSLVYILSKFLRKKGYVKSAKTLVATVVLFFSWLIVMIFFGDFFFTKNDAIDLLAEQQIVLKDDFAIMNNSSSSWMTDHYHTFTLKISRSDHIRIMQQIKQSPYFQPTNTTPEDLYLTAYDRYFGARQNLNFENGEAYVTEYLQPNGKGYAPTFHKISISRSAPELIFEDIAE